MKSVIKNIKKVVNLFSIDFTNHTLVPVMRAGKQLTETMVNFTTNNFPSIELVKVEVSEDWGKSDSDDMLKLYALPDGRKANYLFHGSSVKSGWVYFIITRNADNAPIVAAQEYCRKVWASLSYIENFYRGGAHFAPKSMASFTIEGQFLVVPDGSILYSADGKKSIFRDGHGVYNAQIKTLLAQSKAKPFKFSASTFGSPTQLALANLSAEAISELTANVSSASQALNSEGYFKFVQSATFGDDRPEGIKGKSIFADVAMMDEVATQIGALNLDGEVQSMLSMHPAFSKRISSTLAEEMYKVATTGGLRGRYAKFIPVPVVDSDKNEHDVTVRKGSRTGQALRNRYPNTDYNSCRATVVVNDDRTSYLGDAAQGRTTAIDFSFSTKGVGTFRDLKGAYIITPDGSRIENIDECVHIVGSEDVKLGSLQLNTIVNTICEVQITEWYKAADVIGVPCGWDTNGKYNGKYDFAKKQNADFDGDGGTLSFC